MTTATARKEGCSSLGVELILSWAGHWLRGRECNLDYSWHALREC